MSDVAGINMETVADLEITPQPAVAPVPSWPELGRRIGSRLVGLTLSLGAVGAAVWFVMLFIVTVYVIVPQNDFGRFYHSAAAYWKADGMYAWNPTVPGIIPGVNTLDGEEVTVDLLNLNPPHFHLLFLPLALLPIESAYCIWVLLGLACVWLSVRMTMQEVGAKWTPRARQLAWLVFLGSAVSAVMVNIGQIGWVLLLPVTLMWLAARRGQWAACGAWLGLLASVKPFFLIFVPYLLLKRQWRALASAVVSGVAVIALCVPIFGVEAYRNWLAALGPADSWGWLEMNASLWGTLMRSLSENPLYVPVAYLGISEIKLLWLVLGGAMGLLTLLVAGGDRSDQRLDRAFALLLVGTVLFSPLGWIYYFPLPLGPLAAVLIAWRREQRDATLATPWQLRRWWLLGLALAGLFCQVGWTRTYQFEPVATLTLGSIYFWTAFLVWLTLIRDGLRHVSLPVNPFTAKGRHTQRPATAPASP